MFRNVAVYLSLRNRTVNERVDKYGELVVMERTRLKES